MASDCFPLLVSDCPCYSSDLIWIQAVHAEDIRTRQDSTKQPFPTSSKHLPRLKQTVIGLRGGDGERGFRRKSPTELGREMGTPRKETNRDRRQRVSIEENSRHTFNQLQDLPAFFSLPNFDVGEQLSLGQPLSCTFRLLSASPSNPSVSSRRNQSTRSRWYSASK